MLKRTNGVEDDAGEIVRHRIKGNLCTGKHRSPRSAGIIQISFRVREHDASHLSPDNTEHPCRMNEDLSSVLVTAQAGAS